MREIRPSGSEGGGAFRSPYPYQSGLRPHRPSYRSAPALTSFSAACLASPPQAGELDGPLESV